MKHKYTLIDSGHFQKLEQVGPYILVRPSPQAVWSPKRHASDWQLADATFQRFKGGDGKWTTKNNSLPKRWAIEQGPVTFTIGLTDFGHLGIFPEQNKNWQTLHDHINKVRQGSTEFQVLNLFAYTGGSTIACASAGAKVVHVDASKTSVQWARDNAAASGLKDAPVRWIVEDVQKFVEREVRRGSKYHGIILDPPSFGRGTNNEVWQVEDHLIPLLHQLRKLMSPDLSFVLLSCHSNGYTPMALTNLLKQTIMRPGDFDLPQGDYIAEEMLIFEEEPPREARERFSQNKTQDPTFESLHHRALPSGASCLFMANAK